LKQRKGIISNPYTFNNKMVLDNYTIPKYEVFKPQKTIILPCLFLIFFIILKVMVKKFEILEHPADIGIKAYGNDDIEAFESAAEGLYSIMFENIGTSNEISKTVTIESIDPEALVVKWLNEILYYFDADELVGNLVKVKNIEFLNGNYTLNAEISGEKFLREKHKFKIGVKAVTFHQLEIIKSDNGTTVQVFFDI
jgi:SHS2 domain-containing protein